MKNRPKILYLGLWALCLSSFFSCSEKKTALPEHVLSQDEMVKVLADIQIAEAAVTIKGLPIDSSKKYLDEYYAAIFIAHGITKEKLQESFRFYEARPDLLNDIYDAVVSELSKRQGEAANN